MAKTPLKYEPLRDAQRLAADEAQQRQDKAEQAARDTPQPQKAEPEIDREKIQTQARNAVEFEKAKRFEWQKVAYAQRQQEEAARKERSARSDEYLKEHDPRAYASQERDKRVRAEWASLGKQDPAEQSRGQDQKSRGEQSEKTREQTAAGQEQKANKWRREMSDEARAAVDKSQAREREERERQRSDR